MFMICIAKNKSDPDYIFKEDFCTCVLYEIWSEINQVTEYVYVTIFVIIGVEF